MGAHLEDRVALWLSAHPASTLEQIARGVQARNVAVREVLTGGLFTYTNVGGSRLYRLGAKGRDGLGRAPETDCDFLERVLSDGEPHNLNAILRQSFAERGVGLTVHSRAAELRTKRSLDVRNWKDGERGAGSWYRLVGTAEEVGGMVVGPPEASPASSATSSGSYPSPPPGGVAVDSDGQLVMDAAPFRKSAAA